jgi:hypothetical protein
MKLFSSRTALRLLNIALLLFYLVTTGLALYRGFILQQFSPEISTATFIASVIGAVLAVAGILFATHTRRSVILALLSLFIYAGTIYFFTNYYPYAWVPSTGTQQDSAVTPTSKTYEKKRGGGGSLDIVAQNGTYTIHLIAGGASNGAATSADCEIYATGTKSADKLTATFTPFDGDSMSYSAKEAAAQKRTIVMTLTPTAAYVRSADINGYCADGVNPDGVYLPPSTETLPTTIGQCVPATVALVDTRLSAPSTTRAAATKPHITLFRVSRTPGLAMQ